jgi:signal transduction histidine kinase
VKVAVESGTDVELAWLRSFADLSYLVAHEINNLLNNICLQISIVELTASEKTAATLQQIRKMATETAAKLHQFQQLSQEFRPAAQRADLNPILQEALSRISAGAESPLRTLKLDLDPQLPRVLAPPEDLRRLIDLLAQDALAASESEQVALTFRTRCVSSRATLIAEDTGPCVPEPLRESLFEPFRIVRPGSDGLRLAICRAVVRRLGGSIYAEEPAGGGVRIVIQFPASGV